MSRRLTILKWIKNTIVNSNLIKIQKININRPIPIYINDVPCIQIYHGTEVSEIISGSKERPVVYRKTIPVMVELIANASATVDEFLDDEIDKISLILLSSEKDDFVHSINVLSCDPVDFEIGGNYFSSTIIQLSIVYELPAIVELKTYPFESFKVDILKNVDSEDVAISGEGNF